MSETLRSTTTAVDATKIPAAGAPVNKFTEEKPLRMHETKTKTGLFIHWPMAMPGI